MGHGVEHPIEVREVVLRVIALAESPEHPFWGLGFTGEAAVAKLAAVAYQWLTDVVAEPHRKGNAFGEYTFGGDLPRVRDVAPIVPDALADLVEYAMTHRGAKRVGSLEAFVSQLVQAQLENEPDLDDTDPHRRRTTQELLDSSVRLKRTVVHVRVSSEPEETFLKPWKQVADGDALRKALELELPADHVLAGREVRALARRSGSSEALFELVSDPPLVAVVHLRWAPPLADHPHLPWTRLFESFATWRATGMAADHELWAKAQT